MRGNGSSKFIELLVFLLVLLAASGCVETPDSGNEPASVNESATYWPTEGWRTSTPEQQGMESEKLAELLDYIQEKDINIHSLLIIRNGYVVADVYFYPFTNNSVHDVASVTKSFTGTLIGIAISERYIAGVNQPVLDFFPNRTVANVDANKKAMTLEDLLTMRSGLECVNEPYEITTEQMEKSPDWIQFALDLPMAEEPGTRFVYCSSNSHLLSGIISETTGMNESDYAQERLFEPLGISNFIWPSDPQGNNYGWGDLHMTPHDMAKLGYLYLNNGKWDGKQIVPAEWVSESTREQVSLEEDERYVYQWWVPDDNLPERYDARGRGTQLITVVPEENLIVVTTGGGFNADETAPFLVAALKSDKPLPENPAAYGRLQEEINAAAEPPEPGPVRPLPETAKEIEGKTYVLDSNPLDLQSLSLTFDEEKGEALFTVGVAENQTLEYLLGLDNVYRFSPGEYGLPVAGKGSWESDNVFVAYIDEVANINHYKVTATYQDDQVTILVQDPTWFGDVEFGGRLEGSSEQEAAARNNTSS
ncbi:serine hydrolase domain-containing protein [Methanosarcina mazei]|uniref:6-aminohexanoate hydrolase n=1 Tax=Methanosarcina mazei TaxID=2209 RepID=A0A0F8I0K4_METMZ|nr:serine hydrolase [Methanosarcina mazei]KKG83437.1 6-aminohexanoate hydrolase [Methanosarcina mazei]